MRLCPEYDNAASATRTADGPQWNERPTKCHIAVDLMDDVEAAGFIKSTYAVSDGCDPCVLHGDLLSEVDCPSGGAHYWLLRPESDTAECAFCGADR